MKCLGAVRRLSVLLVVVFALSSVAGCNRADSSPSERGCNYSPNPPSGYSGAWVVCWSNSSEKWIESTYVDGIKEGVEVRWYRDFGTKMSSHTFRRGMLHGRAVKYASDGRVLVDGVFELGQPVDGTFLENYDGTLDSRLDVIQRNSVYFVLEYKQGKLVKRIRGNFVTEYEDGKVVRRIKNGVVYPVNEATQAVSSVGTDGSSKDRIEAP